METAKPPALRLTYRLDAQTEGANREALRKAVDRLQAVRHMLDGVQFDVPHKYIRRSVEELAEITMVLVKLKSRL